MTNDGYCCAPYTVCTSVFINVHLVACIIKFIWAGSNVLSKLRYCALANRFAVCSA